MGEETLVNLLVSMGVPGVSLLVLVYLFRAYTPKVIEAYKETKAKEQESFEKRQNDYREQSEKIVEVATASKDAIIAATKAQEEGSEVHKKVVVALDEMGKSFKALNDDWKDHNRHTEEMNVKLEQILENARKGACQ